MIATIIQQAAVALTATGQHHLVGGDSQTHPTHHNITNKPIKETITMSKKQEQQTVEQVEQTVDTTQELARIIVGDDGQYHVLDLTTGETGPACKLVDEGDKTIALTTNTSNRKWANRAKADAAIAELGHFSLYYKESKHFGSSTSTKLPNAKLIAYLSDEEQAEYKAIIDRARAAMEADKSKPKTDLEKAKEKLAKAQAALAKLEAEAAGTTDAVTDAQEEN